MMNVLFDCCLVFVLEIDDFCPLILKEQVDKIKNKKIIKVTRVRFELKPSP